MGGTLKENELKIVYMDKDFVSYGCKEPRDMDKDLILLNVLRPLFCALTLG